MNLLPGSCLYKGSQYPDGEHIPDPDPCLYVQCSAGYAGIVPDNCPEYTWPWVCADTVKRKDRCCLSCPSGGK